MDSEWNKLSRRLYEEPHLPHARLTPELLALAATEDGIVIRMQGGAIIVCAILLAVLNDEWFELGTIWVEKQFRFAGLHTGVFRECIEKQKDVLFFSSPLMKASR